MVMENGLEFDRQFVVVDAQSKVLTGREQPKLLSIQSVLEGSELLLHAPEMKELRLSMVPSSSEHLDIHMFSTLEKASATDPYCDDWISDLLGMDCRLFILNKETPRFIKSKYGGQDGESVNFSDISPIHLLSEESLNDLNSRLTLPVTMDHFRPNLVVRGCDAYEEDNWKSIRIGECLFDIHFKSPRCTFTTIDPMTHQGDSNGEPLRTLSSYRKSNNYVNFGVYMIPRKLGKIIKGDAVELIA